MALTIWGSTKSASIETIVSGANVSVAVVASGSTLSLKWKREKRDGTWPADAEAVPIATLSATGPFRAQQTALGVLIGDGSSRFWLTKKTNPTQQSDFQAVTTIQ